MAHGRKSPVHPLRHLIERIERHRVAAWRTADHERTERPLPIRAVQGAAPRNALAALRPPRLLVQVGELLFVFRSRRVRFVAIPAAR